MTKMANKLRVVVALFAVIGATLSLSAAEKVTPMRQVRDMVRDAKVVEVGEELCIEGYIISKPHGHNNDLNIQVHYASLKNDDLATIYIESLTGDVGLRIKLADRKFAPMFPRYSKVLLSLKGATLRYTEPCGVTVYGLTDKSIVQIKPCLAEELPRKEKRIGELTDDDIYTYVTLKDCELVFKDGALSNVYERYVQQTPFNRRTKPNKSMDGWATLLCDKSGSPIYALINTLCRWRRDGSGAPQGSGDMCGIVSHIALPRYGGDVLGRYILLPVDGEDFKMAREPEKSSFKSIAEWNWSDNKKAFSTEYGDLENVATERILADIGKGRLKIPTGCEAIRGRDTNNPRVDAGKEKGTKGFGGFVRYGALAIKTEAHNWWDWKKNCGKGIEVEFSTKGLSGKQLLFGFTFAAGEISAATSYGFPVFWNVEYSTDGKKWFKVEGSAPKKLRTLPWHWSQNVHDIHYDSVLAGAGYTEHLVVLPNSLFGKSKVLVRVVPVAKNTATLGYDYNENGALRHNSMEKTVVNFGSVVVRYN